MILAYRISDGVVVGSTGTNSRFPDGPPDDAVEQWKARFGPGINLLRLHDVDDADVVAQVFTHEITVTDGHVVVGDPLPPPPQPAADPRDQAIADLQEAVDLLVAAELERMLGGNP